MTFFIIGLGIGLIIYFQRERTRGPERKAGHNFCAFCASPLKQTPNHLHYATTCRKCGKTQPWAK